MAKKKDLTPYQQARRQFVQQRVEKRGVEGTPEQRAQFRQRFDVLASTVQGRGKIAQQLGAEEPKAFRRMLSTELPTRKDLGKTTSTTSTTTTTTTGPSYTADQIARMRTAAATMGPQLSQVIKAPLPGSFGATQKVSSYTGPALSTTKKSKLPTINNPIARAVSKGLQAVVPGLSDVAQARKEIDKGNVVGGLGRLAAGTAATAATVMSIFGVGSSPAAGPSPKPSKAPTRPKPPTATKGAPTRPTAPKGQLPSKTRINDELGKQMDDYQATLGNLKNPTKTPTKTKTVTPKTKTVTPKTKTVTPKTETVAPTKATKTEPVKATKTEPVKTAPTKDVKTEPVKATKTEPVKPAKVTKATKAKAEDANFVLSSLKAKYPKAQESDIPFLQKVLRAQQAIAKNEPSARQYEVYLNSPVIQKQLRALRGR